MQKMLKQDNTAKEMKLERISRTWRNSIQRNYGEIIKVIRVHSQEEIEIEWKWMMYFLGQR